MATHLHQSSLAEELDDLASALESLDLSRGSAGWGTLSSRRDRLARSIRTYSIPRLTGDPGPLLVVFAGPTGSGKSTLVNSLSGLEFSETGPLRPTTTRPVVLARDRNVSAFHRISGVDCEVIGGRAPILASIALVDTPDLDSTSTQNRAKAEILIDNADIVVFVTSALRYADLVPWEVLRRASSRGAPVINVINRLGAGSAGAVTDFRARLNNEGLGADVVRVPEHHLSEDRHQLPRLAIRELQVRILAKTAELDGDRREVVDRVVRSTATQVLEFADELESLVETAGENESEARAILKESARALDLAPLCDGMGPIDPPHGVVTGLIWTWRNHLGGDKWLDTSATIQQRLISIVEGDIRQTVARQGSGTRLSRDVVQGLRSNTRSLAQAWLIKVEALTGSRSRLGGRLASLVLTQAAVTGRPTPAFDRMFEDGSLIVRAHRALVGKLETLYDQIASQIQDRDNGQLSRDDAERLRKLAGAVSARSHFADA